MKRLIYTIIILSCAVSASALTALEETTNPVYYGNSSTIQGDDVRRTMEKNAEKANANFSELATSISGKAASTCFANSTALSACFPELTVGGDDLGSATSTNIVALFTGTGDCLGANGQKVACGSGSTGIAHAPSDGKYYVSKDGGWVDILADAEIITASVMGWTSQSAFESWLGWTFTGGSGFSYVSSDPSPIVDNTSWYRTDTGELKIATSAGVRTFTGTLAAWDYTPGAFTFTALTDQATDGALKCSDPTTPTGYNRATTWTVSGDTGCSAKINTGAAATSGSIAPTQTIAACVNGSTSNSTTTTCTPRINGVSADPGFSVTTTSDELAIYDDFSTDTTSNYTNISQTLSVSAGAAHGSQWDTTIAYNETPTGSNDHWVEGTCSYASGGVDNACLILGSNGTEYYGVYFSGSTIRIGVPGGYINYDGGYAAGNTYNVAAQIDTDGNGKARFNLWVGGIKVIDNYSDTSAGITRGQYVGVRIGRGTANSDVTVDNLTANAGAYTP